ncbi:MAG: polysaccharide biosynthesis C-terminal domain-containing protein, partial [Clostridia bacterium]|nr:polysaccharide biosynthesis C-terminal domain-containing protein [Clostridia bacterium]
MNEKEKCLANKGFYKGVLAVAVPIMVQNGITNFVSLLDNIMVGKLGTETMSGVSIVNQFIFIFYLLIFGAISAAGIFTSQYHGLKDEDGVRYTFRFKVLICTVTSLVSALVFFLFDEPIINLFLYESEGTGDLALTLAEGKKYLYVMLFGLLPYSLSQTYASTMRETGDALRPMIASIIAVAVNFVLNLSLIFGLLGFPALGAQGAAIATVISRFAELFYLVLYAHRRKNKFPYLKQAYASFRIPVKLFRLIFAKGMPLMLNECLWSLAMT